MLHNTTQKKNKTPGIFPFSANPQLTDEDIGHLSVYYKYLEAAFNETRIHNLAITGEFGIGKSSVLRSFENNYIADKNKGFLYISLGEFKELEMSVSTDHQSSIDDGQTQREESKKNAQKEDETKEANTIERRILLQMYARFRQKDLPLSGFTLIREKINFHAIKAIVGAIFVFIILLLINYEQLGNLIKSAFPFIKIVEFLTIVHLLLYLLALINATVLAGFFIYWLIPKIQVKNLAVKTDQVELALEREACESYIDKHSMELVYCLEQIAEKINYTVVFEDLDRLKPITCVEIFERLREINYLVNLRVNRVRRNIRFIYIVNNNIIGNLEHQKFFDYILPIVSVMNTKTAELIFRKNLKEIDKYLEADFLDHDDGSKYFECVEKSEVTGIVHQIMPYLIDFRKQYAVLNDYSLLLSIYHANNDLSIQENDALHILAFSVYKNFWPDDYEKIAVNRSKIIPFYNPKEIKGWDNIELLKILLESKPPLLNARCMYYMGYRETDIKNWFLNILISGRTDEEKIEWINLIQSEDKESIKGICYACQKKGKNDSSTEVEKFFLTDHIGIFKAVIIAAIRCRYTDSNWFFNNRYIMDCIAILSELDDKQVKDFYDLSGFSQSGNVFKTCYMGNGLENTRVWKARELRVFCLGVRSIDGDIEIRVEIEKNKIVRVLLPNTLKIFWNKHDNESL